MKAKFLIIPLLICAGLFSCEKETDSVENSMKLSESMLKSNSIQKINGVLIFPDTTFVKSTLTLLQSELTQWSSLFDNTYGHLTETQMENLVDSINYNEYEPLADFEASYSFYSLRSKLQTDETNWLLNTSGDRIEDDPDNHFIDDKIVRSFLNVHCEMGIGSSLYKFVQNGYYEITDGDFATLLRLRSNPINITGLKNVIFYKDGDMKSGCNSTKRKAGEKTVGSKRIKWVIVHWTYPWGRHVTAKTDNYKKKSNNKWKKYKTYCEAQVYGDVSGAAGDCSTTQTFNTLNGYYIFENSKKDVCHKISVSTKTKSGWVKGYHKGAGGITYTSTLTWN